MAKKKINPKVKAGKKRAKLSLRDSKGRFTTNVFKREVIKTILAKRGINVSKDQTKKDRAEVDRVIKEARITQTELNKEYKKNIDIFSEMIYSGGLLSSWRNFNQILSDIEKYNGRFGIRPTNREPWEIVTKDLAKLRVRQFKQLISSHLDASDFTMKYLLTFDGTLVLTIPDMKPLRKQAKEIESEEDTDDFFEEVTKGYDYGEDIIIYRSPGKSKK